MSTRIIRTEKSVAFSFFFFVAFGMYSCKVSPSPVFLEKWGEMGERSRTEMAGNSAR